jgi:hypothetical protein
MADESTATSEGPRKQSFANFLETSPPDTGIEVDSLAARNQYGLVLDEADIHLHCNSEQCEGKGELQFYHNSDSVYLEREKWKFVFLVYVCRNCRRTQKTFAVAAKLGPNGNSGSIFKLGESPAFGPQIPARVITLIGPDREVFLKGRRAENHGLGIGAFAYYRRVVENQKGRIIQEMAKVAGKLGASESDLKLFEAAAKEKQFTTAIDKIKSAIPSALRIYGHNPLTLLHDALSDGLHQLSDEECLERAREVRLVLTDLAERMSEALREEAELKDAVSKLLSRGARRKDLET